MNDKVLYRKGNAVSEVCFVPYGEQVLIKTVGWVSILDIFSNKESLSMGMNCFIAGLGDKVYDKDIIYFIGDEVTVGDSESYSFKSIVIPNAEKTISWYKKNESSPELIIANAVLKDKANSKMALNNSHILAGINANAGIINTDGKPMNPQTKHQLFANKEVEVVAYYTTHVNNLTGVYVKPTTETK